MNLQIKNYLNQIYSEIQECYSDEINLQETDFEKYSIFDFVNFHLIYQYILNDNSNKHDFFIGIPEVEYRENFFASIFHSIILIKLYQNYFNYETISPILNKGDLVYGKYNKRHRIFRIISTYKGKIKANYKFPKRNEFGISDFSLNKPNFTKLNPNLVDSKNTAKNIDAYREFLTSTFSENFPFITDFKNRTLVIAEKKFFKESKFLPIRYTNKNGKISNDLPFFSYLVECCNDFNSAQNFLLNKGQTFNEVIIIGDTKYRDDFDFILQEKYRDKYKNIILIGTEKPSSENEFLEWWWSNEEIKIANNELPSNTKKVCLINNNLYSIFTELKGEILKIKDKTKVNLAFILKYTNFFLRMILVNTNLSKGIYQEYLDRLNHYFQSEAFSEELNNIFYEKDIFNPDEIKRYTDHIFILFSKISNTLKSENLKWNYIKQTAKEINPKPIYVVVEKKNYDAVSNQTKNENIHNIRLISDKRIDNSKPYLDKWLNGNQNSQNKLVIAPYLNNMELYTKMKAIKGNCEIVCYENLDEISFDKVEKTYQNQEKTKLIHNDRLEFFKTNFTHSTEVQKRDLDDVFSFDLNNENFKSNPYEALDLPRESAIYEVQFSDGTIDKFDSSKGVFLIEGNEQINTTIGEVYEGATIRFYQNDDKKLFHKVLDILDSENVMDEFDFYADSWKNTLKTILSIKYANQLKSFYQELFNSHYKIHYNTFRLYFKDYCETRFPDIETLELINKFCSENGFSNELISNELDIFIKYKKVDFSIRNKAGRNIGDDLIEYENSGYSEKSNFLEELPEDILQKLLLTVQAKTIKKKKLLEYDKL